MGVAYASERRLLAEEEIESLQSSHFPLIEGLSRENLLELARWLRSRRMRARDLMRERRRIDRGKAEAHGALSVERLLWKRDHFRQCRNGTGDRPLVPGFLVLASRSQACADDAAA